MFKRSLVSAAVLVSCVGAAWAQPAAPKSNKPAPAAAPAAAEPTLKVGNAAPAIKVDKWVKGSDVSSFQAGKPYVVEFWATWCPPCRKSIPHLTQLAKDHKDLTIIGVASSERTAKDGADKRLETVEKFVKDKGDEMDYTIAYDGDREMGKEWMGAAGVNTIPTAFIVDGKGKITWIGNPLDDAFEAELGKVVAPTTATPPAKPADDGHTKPKGNK